MARAATTTDVFNVLGEPRRRQIIDLLAHGERAVGDLAEALGQAQPHVSRHLRVLREVGLVDARDEGRRRLYHLDARPLREIHTWTGRYEQHWNERFDAIDDVLADLVAESPPHRGSREERT